MTKFKFAFIAALLLMPMTFSGCGGSNDVTVLPEPEVMTEEQEAAYEAESYDSGGDEQN